MLIELGSAMTISTNHRAIKKSTRADSREEGLVGMRG